MIKNIPIQYVTDEEGNKQAVVIPFDKWRKIQKELAELGQYRTMKKNLKAAFREIEEIKQGKKTLITLNEFLNES